VLVVAIYAIVTPLLFAWAGGSSFVSRLALSVLLLGGLGFLLGMPFPTALRALSSTGQPLVPWSIGVNAFASVFGASSAIPLAMLVGHRWLLYIGAALYVAAILTAPVGRTGSSPGESRRVSLPVDCTTAAEP
jgi:hypothetical protein